MATYYYAAFQDEYTGFGKPGKTDSLTVARKNLIARMKRNYAEAGVIATVPDLDGISEHDRAFVGSINANAGPVINGKMTADYYIWFPKGSKKKYLVKSDGNVVEYEGKRQIIEMRTKRK